ncbi:mannan-binding lectin [Rhodobacteraceae bacterium N5(2021)]|uniref:Mannan-binding lectin n=1 Tax=Gymnodinialimonas phycosphaerae TaxID=2841589 RepID=A0A975TRZ7_9RHOB|nr:mannan-binding lectin [Gymnodinialimonas phycosphaerae]MBY4893415.1 mannan-binding lectin [Gymnodinialimonas phycosphaerae]
MKRLSLLIVAALLAPLSATAQQSVEAGPTWNQGHAEQVCPAITASQGATWTGHWWTTIANEMSVCQIR